MYVCAPHVCLVPTLSREGSKPPGNVVTGGSQPRMWVLGAGLSQGTVVHSCYPGTQEVVGGRTLRLSWPVVCSEFQASQGQLSESVLKQNQCSSPPSRRSSPLLFSFSLPRQGIPM